MNATAVETLERRLDATRRALIGEQERLRGWEIAEIPGDPIGMRCHSCGARPGESCQSPTGEPLEQPHATRGAPT